jgi:hypothetical protein
MFSSCIVTESPQKTKTSSGSEVHPQVQHGEVVLPGFTLPVYTLFTKPER